MPGLLEQALEIAKDQKRKLGVTIGSKSFEPGDFIPKAETHTTPRLAFSATNPTTKYVAICIDLDAPFAALPFLSPICHWLQTDLDAQLATATPPVIPYHGAGPPPIARAPHRYVFMLFEQPAGLERRMLKCARPEGEAFPMTARMRFDLEGVVRGAGLGEVAASNWFTSL